MKLPNTEPGISYWEREQGWSKYRQASQNKNKAEKPKEQTRQLYSLSTFLRHSYCLAGENEKEQDKSLNKAIYTTICLILQDNLTFKIKTK